MDFTLIDKKESGEVCYKLLRAVFYRDYYIIIVQSKKEFCCGSIHAASSEAHRLFCEIAASATEPYCLSDILRDYEKQRV